MMLSHQLGANTWVKVVPVFVFVCWEKKSKRRDICLSEEAGQSGSGYLEFSVLVCKRCSEYIQSLTTHRRGLTGRHRNRCKVRTYKDYLMIDASVQNVQQTASLKLCDRRQQKRPPPHMCLEVMKTLFLVVKMRRYTHWSDGWFTAKHLGGGNQVKTLVFCGTRRVWF